MKRRKFLGLFLLVPLFKYAKKPETILDRYFKKYPELGKFYTKTGFWYCPYIPLTIRNAAI